MQLLGKKKNKKNKNKKKTMKRAIINNKREEYEKEINDADEKRKSKWATLRRNNLGKQKLLCLPGK